MNHEYEQMITVSAEDAIEVLRTNVIPKMEVGYESYKVNPVDPQLAYEAFVKTLSLNFEVEDSVSKDALSRYIPVFAVVDYNGLRMSVYKKYQSANGLVLDRVWLPKIPFSKSDIEGNVVNFTIDDNIEVYDADLGEWFEGPRKDVLPNVTVPMLIDDDEFDKIRRQTIIDITQENIAYYINEHNVYTRELGVTYQFHFPLINEDHWYNTVDDISILAFFQGNVPSLGMHEFNEYAFVGTRLSKMDRILAGEAGGHRRFWKESCGFPYTATEIFNNKKAAVKEGYAEMSCLN